MQEQARWGVTRLTQGIAAMFARKGSPIEVPIPVAPQKGETAWSSDTFFGSRGAPFEAWNPDLLLRNKGAGIYWTMLRDDQVKAAYTFVVGTIVSRSWRFEVTGEDADAEKQQEIADYFSHVLNSVLRGTPQQLFKNVMSSKATGYSVVEMVFGPTEWQGRTMWALRAAKLKPFHTFRWRVDPFGNVIDLMQDQGSAQVALDPRKFLIHITNAHIDPVFGESELRAAYRPYWEKENILKFWDIYLERFAGGFATATVKGALASAEKTALQSTIRNLSSSTGILLPDGVEIEMNLPASTDAFEKAVNQRDMAITRALLMPALLGLAPEQATGARAQSETQRDAFLQIMGMEGDQLVDVLNEQLFRPLAEWNFGTTDIPKLKFDPFTEGQKRAAVEAWGVALEKGIVHNLEGDEGHVRDLLGFDPLPNDFDWEAEAEKARELFMPAAKQEAVADPKEAEKEERSKARDAKLSEHGRGLPAWRMRFDARDAESRLNSIESSMGEAMAGAVDAIYAAVKSALGEAKEKAGEKPDYEALASRIDAAIPPPLMRALNQAIRDGLQEGYDNGRATAVLELNRAVEGADVKLAERIRVGASVSQRIASKLGCSPLNFTLGLGTEAAVKYLQAKSFEIAGVLSEAIRNAAKQVLLDGIKKEWTLAQMIEALDKLLGDIIGPLDSAGHRINIPARLATIARTNLTDAFNQARLSAFTDPSIGDFVKAYMYDAIMDGRTTETCRIRDGRIYLKDDPIWKVMTPPAHFNCRSVLTAITALDTDWTVAPPLPSGGESAKGF